MPCLLLGVHADALFLCPDNDGRQDPPHLSCLGRLWESLEVSLQLFSGVLLLSGTPAASADLVPPLFRYQFHWSARPYRRREGHQERSVEVQPASIEIWCGRTVGSTDIVFLNDANGPIRLSAGGEHPANPSDSAWGYWLSSRVGPLPSAGPESEESCECPMRPLSSCWSGWSSERRLHVVRANEEIIVASIFEMPADQFREPGEYSATFHLVAYVSSVESQVLEGLRLSGSRLSMQPRVATPQVELQLNSKPVQVRVGRCRGVAKDPEAVRELFETRKNAEKAYRDSWR